jgi:hypothetical protein
MTRGKKILLAAAAFGSVVAFIVGDALLEAPATAVRVLEDTEVTHLLTPSQLQALELQPRPGELDVTAAGNILMLSAGQIHEIEKTDRSIVADRKGKPPGNIESFALDRGNAVLTIAAQHFGQLEDDGSSSQAFPLPSPDMKIAASAIAGHVYLFGGTGASARRLYALDEDGGIDIIAELPDPIVAVADSLVAVYVATTDVIYRLTPKNAVIRLSVKPETLGGPLYSLAASEDDKTLFFSTASQVFALQGSGAITLVDNAGGTLRWRTNRLFVWDHHRRLIFTLSASPR